MVMQYFSASTKASIFRKEKKFYGHELFIFVRPLLTRGFEHTEPFHVKVICVTQINPTGKKLEGLREICR